MQRTLEQNPWPYRRPLFAPFLIGVPVIAVLLMLVAGARQSVLSVLLFEVPFILMLFGPLLFFVLAISWPEATWILTEHGLKRIEAGGIHLTDGKLSRIRQGGSEQLIRWDQIYRMKSTPNRLFIRWIDSEKESPRVESSAEDENESVGNQFDHCGTLFIPEAESQELISLWRKHRDWGRSEKANGVVQLSSLRRIRADAISKDRAKFTSSLSSLRKLCFGMLAVGLGLIAGGLIYLLWQLVEQYPSYTWPTVEGEVVSQQLRAFRVYRRHHSYRAAELSLVYEYEVAGQKYHSDQYSLWAQKYREREQTVQAYAANYQQGSPIKVYYDPNDPSRTVLMPGAVWSSSSAYLIFGVFLALIGWLVRKTTARASWA
jgi:hypothetical protein